MSKTVIPTDSTDRTAAADWADSGGLCAAALARIDEGPNPKINAQTSVRIAGWIRRGIQAPWTAVPSFASLRIFNIIPPALRLMPIGSAIDQQRAAHWL